MRYLTMAEILLIHQDQLRRYGGDPGLIDQSLLSSALAMPVVDVDKAAAYLFHLCQNHPFIDGNKRVGLAAALVFLDLNGVSVDDPHGVLYDLVIDVTAGKADKARIARVLKELKTSGA